MLSTINTEYARHLVNIQYVWFGLHVSVIVSIVIMFVGNLTSSGNFAADKSSSCADICHDAGLLPIKTHMAFSEVSYETINTQEQLKQVRC